ncbi:hypothetical protein AB0O91_35335 [Kitasatospora sp. NPDC089797]|uniref:hypothetical protein n=1 Tax=Kitasatospora sp. NPDC089797 TaxID=3155298 RepID=UPI003423FFE7
MWPDPVRGRFLGRDGPHAAHPVRCLAHTDGRAGAGNSAGDGVFQELETSMTHRIEAHAVMDEVSAWDPWPDADYARAVARQSADLSEVAELAAGAGE